MRQYPVLSDEKPADVLPVSFVIIHYCDEYFHNALKSPCVVDQANELVTVDNRWGHRFETLSQAINSGVDRTHNDLVVVMHEDVVLVEGWQARLQKSLAALERHDSAWGLAGSVGWDEDGKIAGHWSDPHRYVNTFEEKPFAQVMRLDEQILIFRKSVGLRFDPNLPSIHNIGQDIASTLEAMGRRCYAIDAPTIHKYADANGEPIGSAAQSPKIRSRYDPSNFAEWQCSSDYLVHKWPRWAGKVEAQSPELDKAANSGYIAPPVIAMSASPGASALLTALLQDASLFMGLGLTAEEGARLATIPCPLPANGQCEMMRESVLHSIFAAFQRRPQWMRELVRPRLRSGARAMLDHSKDISSAWGFNLPENYLAVPQLDAAFPGARFVHLLADPLEAIKEKADGFSNFDTALGRTAIRAAYTALGRPVAESLTDHPALRHAMTLRHRIEHARRHAATRLGDRWLEIRLEDIQENPQATLDKLCHWFGRGPALANPAKWIWPDVGKPLPLPMETANSIAAVLEDLRRDLGYIA